MEQYAGPRQPPPQLQQAQLDSEFEMPQIDDMHMPMPKRKVISAHEKENQIVLARNHTELRGRPFLHSERVDQASTKRLALADTGAAAVVAAARVAVADVGMAGVEAEEMAVVEAEETAGVAAEARAVEEAAAVIAAGSGPDSPEQSLDPGQNGPCRCVSRG